MEQIRARTAAPRYGRAPNGEGLWPAPCLQAVRRQTSFHPAISFVRALVRAAGLSMAEDGSILSRGGRVVRRFPVSMTGRALERECLALIEWSRDQHGDQAALVAAFSRHLRFDDLGVVGLAVKTAPTLRTSLRTLEKYATLLGGAAKYRLEEGRARAALAIENREALSAAYSIRSECTFAAIFQTIRCIAGGAPQIDHVSFRHPCSGAVEQYSRLFECPVHFGRDRAEIVFAAGALDQPNRLGDRAVFNFMTDRLDERLSVPGTDDSLKSVLLGRVADALESGMPRAADIAYEIGMSERTMYRRLAGEGWTYRDVVREAQTTLARELLAGSDCPIAEIALRTGFSEQSTFSRAFKQRVGHTPAEYRRLDWDA